MKRRTQKRILYIIWFVFLLPTFLISQVLVSRNISINDGLAYSQVVCADFDSNGYLWFGTVSGLSRWDGKKFKNYYIENGLYSNHITDIIYDSNFKLVVATQKGINFVHDKNVIVQPKYPEELKTRIAEVIAYDGRLIVAAEDKGLWAYDTNKFKLLTKDIHAYSLFVNSKNELLVGSIGKIYKITADSTEVIINMDKHNSSIINEISESSKSEIIIGTHDKGLFIYKNDGAIVRLNKNNGLPSNRINDIKLSKTSGEIYIATSEGVAIIENYKPTRIINIKNGLATDFVWEIVQNNNNYYFLTDGDGFYEYFPNKFEYYNTETGIADNTIWHIDEQQNGDIWLATDNGISIIGESSISNFRTNLQVKNDVISIYNKNGIKYIGTNDDGVAIIRDNNLSFINKSNGLTSRSVWSIISDEKDNIYFSTFDGGICVLKNNSIIDTLNTEDGLPNNDILTSYFAKDSSLYFSFDEAGVYKYSGGNLSPLRNQLNNCIIWAINEDSYGNLLLGSNNLGLFVLKKNGGIDTIGVKDGMTNNSVVGIAVDKDKIYASADKGLNIITVSNSGYSVRQMYTSDGLPSNECNQNAITKDSKGNIWIGTINGALKYNPKADIPDLSPLKLELASVKVFNKKINFFDGIEFHYSQDFLEFEFTAINFLSPQKTKFAYRINDNDEWTISNRNFIQFARLESGKYNLEVKAINEWGIWSEPVKLKFSILPIFYKTWWFIASIALLLGLIVGWIIYNRFMHLLAIERLRSKISSDLHDDIGAGLSEVSFLSEIIHLKLDKSELNKISVELKKIGTVSRELVSSMSDIVWLVNPKNDSLFNLISRLGDSYQTTLSSKNIVLHLNNTESLKSINLPMEYRQNLYLLIKEGINNSFKYSQCNNIFVKTFVVNRELIIELSDDGIGFDISTVKKGNGIGNIYTRSKNLKGEVNIISTIGKGTTIKFTGKLK